MLGEETEGNPPTQTQLCHSEVKAAARQEELLSSWEWGHTRCVTCVSLPEPLSPAPPHRAARVFGGGISTGAWEAAEPLAARSGQETPGQALPRLLRMGSTQDPIPWSASACPAPSTACPALPPRRAGGKVPEVSPRPPCATGGDAQLIATRVPSLPMTSAGPCPSLGPASPASSPRLCLAADSSLPSWGASRGLGAVLSDVPRGCHPRELLCLPPLCSTSPHAREDRL